MIFQQKKSFGKTRSGLGEDEDIQKSFVGNASQSRWKLVGNTGQFCWQWFVLLSQILEEHVGTTSQICWKRITFHRKFVGNMLAMPWQSWWKRVNNLLQISLEQIGVLSQICGKPKLHISNECVVDNFQQSIYGGKFRTIVIWLERSHAFTTNLTTWFWPFKFVGSYYALPTKLIYDGILLDVHWNLPMILFVIKYLLEDLMFSCSEQSKMYKIYIQRGQAKGNLTKLLI